MKRFKDFINENFENGVYIEVEVDKKSKELIKEYCKENNIPTNDDYHCTIIYSKKKFVGKIEKKDINIKTKAEEIVRFDNPDEEIYALALKLKSKDLEDLHKFYMEKYNFIFDYDKYIPHLTLSYKAKNISPKELKVPDFEITFNKMNIEGLDENWADNKK